MNKKTNKTITIEYENKDKDLNSFFIRMKAYADHIKKNTMIMMAKEAFPDEENSKILEVYNKCIIDSKK